jgi:hypothetical protein
MKKLLYLFLVTSIFLSSCSKDCPIPEAQEEWLFVHTAASAKILNTTTIVMPLVDDIFAFTDRPYRKSYHMTGQHYAELWIHQGENCFQDDPPNAVLTWVDGGESKEIEVVITHAVLDSTSITYTIWDDSGIIIEDIVHPSLFVDGANSEVKIGDTWGLFLFNNQQYGGGIVFWLDPERDNGGLIAAPSDQSSGAQWGCNTLEIPEARETGIMKGYMNTYYIYNRCNDEGIAAHLCYELRLQIGAGAAHYDWWLPSKDELNQMYLNIGHGSSLGNVGGFIDYYYWSSTEISHNSAWIQDFSSGKFGGEQDVDSKDETYHVRAVRAF